MDKTENGAIALHARLREMILDGNFPPGSMLSQVKLAKTLGVSRIPLREALRMLQKEGLVEAEHNQRTRIPAFDPSVVDSLYASRILLEALSVRLTIPRLTQADKDAIEQTLAEMNTAAEHDNYDCWEQPHRRFHQLLVSHAETQLRHTTADYTDRCEYYRRMYYRYVSAQGPTRAWSAITAEHQAIARACIAGQSELASHRLALHFARTALTVLGQMTPTFEPIAIRMALSVIGVDASFGEERQNIK